VPIVELTLDSASVAAKFKMDNMGGLDYVIELATRSGLAGYERPYPEFMAQALQHLKGCFLDVGANTGLYALLAAAARPNVQVHAFEPLQAISDILSRNVGLNPSIEPRIRVHRIALSDRTGKATFYETINPYGLFSTSSGLNEAFSRKQGETRRHEVPTITADQWCAKNGVTEIAFMKIDVEGFEREVIAGSQNVIATQRPVIGLELLGDADFEYFAHFIKRHSYIDCTLTPGRLQFGTRPIFVPDGWNHVFLPSERRDLALRIAELLSLDVQA
jgi:FkbM family methyltransferase